MFWVWWSARRAERENEVSCVTGIFKETVRSKLSGVPVIDIRINGKSAKALVDTGCTRTMVRERSNWSGNRRDSFGSV